MTDTAGRRDRARFQSERHDEIVRLIFQRGRVEVSELAERFSMTTETIRRDLDELDRQRVVRRVHGGAVPFESLKHEPRLAVRNEHFIDEKRRIGSLAIEVLSEVKTVIIDAGSTTMMLCEAIPRDIELSVATNSLLNAQILATREKARVFVVGGTLENNTLAVIDTTAVDAIAKLSVDVAFIGCDGISAAHGLSTPYTAEASVKRAMIQAARRSVALVDHSKFGSDQLVQIAPCSAFDLIITDTGLDDNTTAQVEALGPTVRRA